jgi:hypothetical protein
MNFRKIVVVLTLLVSFSAHAVDCPTCTPQELYQENMKLMKTIADDMKALDDALKDLNPSSILTLEKMVAEIGGDGVAQQAMDIAIGNKKINDQAVADAAELVRLEKERNLEELKLETTIAETKLLAKQRDQDPLSLLAQNKELRDKASTPVEKDKPKPKVILDNGLFVTFVQDNSDSSKIAVLISLDGRAISLKIGSQFSYSSERYKLVSVEPTLDRKDNRKWNVYVKKGESKGLYLLDWAS